MQRILRYSLSLIILFGIAEGVLRAGIWFRMPVIADPDLYTDWASDEDYWKLRHLWVKRVTSDSKEILDPLLGWNVPKTQQNPLAATTDAPYSPKYNEPALLFFGDSFVQGVTDFKTRIPQRLATYLPQLPVYNLGVKGYGLDQIYLKFQRTRFAFKRPIILIGIVTVDLDRSILGFRTGQKPYFTFENKRLVLAGRPILPEPQSWIEENPPQIISYFYALISRQLSLLTSENPLEVSWKVQEKKLVNQKILEQIVEEGRTYSAPLLAVLFYTRTELDYEGWREKFLKKSLKKLGTPYVDTKEFLLKEAVRTHSSVSDFYLPEGHLNEKGNEIVASAIADRFRRLEANRFFN